MKKKIDRFLLQDLIADGGNGSVYRAKEQLPGTLARTVALKLLPAVADADTKGVARYIAEMQLLVSLGGHPNIITVFAMGVSEGAPWIAMELLPTSLAQAIREQPAPVEHVREMMRQLTTALAALHGLETPLLHNDLTPANVLINDFGTYKLTDFSLAGPAAVERTRVLATVRYAAPEVLSRDFGVISPATDLYALGHIAYEMSLGGKLYRQQFPAVYDQRMSSDQGPMQKWMSWHCSIETRPANLLDVLPDFPPALSTIIARLMRKNTTERYPSAQALLADLQSTSVTPPPHTAAGVAAAPVSAPRSRAPVMPAPPPQTSPQSPEPSIAGSPGKPPLTPPAGVVDNERYYVRLGPQTSGPFDVNALKTLIRQGKVSRLHKVSTDKVNWKSLSAVEGLA